MGLLQQFVTEFTDEQRRDRFKVIPRVVEGPFIACRAVPQKPAILGTKLDVCFFHEAGDHFEVSVDVYSSVAAKFACSQCISSAKKIVMDVSFVIEAQEATELPEVILGIFR